MNAADKLINKINEIGNPSVVGLDPRLNLLPQSILSEAVKKFGQTTEGAGWAIYEFNRIILDNISDIVGIVKPQMAFYEMYGVAGVEAFEKTVRYAQEKGLLVIEDGKRNDIGSTCLAYASGHLGKVGLFDQEVPSLDVDWLTVNPYLGQDGLNPFIDNCQKYGKGIFVLVKTSNPSSGQFQDVLVKNTDKPLYMTVAEVTAKLAENHLGEKGYSCVGAVVGATYPEEALEIRKILNKSIFLVPGYGKQGGGAMDTMPCFNADGYGAVVNSSRGIIFAYNEKDASCQEENWHQAVRAAAQRMREDLRGALKQSGKLPKGW